MPFKLQLIMSMTSQKTCTSESNSSNIATESTNSNNTGEIRKLNTEASNEVISFLSSERSFKKENNDNHLNRLQSLRKELNYIKETDWMYESAEKKPLQ